MSIPTTELGQEALEVDKPDNDDLTLWSVTTIIGALDRPALTWWACEQTANAAIDNEATWKAMLNDVGRDETITWLCTAKNRLPKNLLSDTTLGTAVHKVCETYALTGTRPDHEFIAAQVEHAGGPQTDINTKPVFSPACSTCSTAGYNASPPPIRPPKCASTRRSGVTPGKPTDSSPSTGVRFIIDYKSTRKPRLKNGKPKTPYTEVALQLAAYRNADFAAVWRPRRFEKQFRRYYACPPPNANWLFPYPKSTADCAS